jgi:hypothetical protein
MAFAAFRQQYLEHADQVSRSPRLQFRTAGSFGRIGDKKSIRLLQTTLRSRRGCPCRQGLILSQQPAR